MAFHPWTSRLSRDFGETVVKARHRLHESQLFSDEALARLIDEHPRDLADFCTPAFDADGGDILPAGEIGDMSGAALLAAARQGRLWINLRQAMNIHSEYQALIETTFAELKKQAPRFRPTRYTGGILISSPSARVPYHLDKTDVVLWHVRGVKRVHVYPNADPYVRDEDLEVRMLDLARDDLPYRSEFERSRRSFELTPGDMLAWPLHSPHRVENVRGLNVSVSTEYSSWRSALSNGAYYTNAVLRRRFGLTPSPAAYAKLPEQAAKLVMAQVFKRLGWGDAAAEPYRAPEIDLASGMLPQA
jgi:hypothetical protein